MKKVLVVLMASVLTFPTSFGQKSELGGGGDASDPSSGSNSNRRKVIVVTGTRFAYPLVQKWIDGYNTSQPDVQIIIESRGSADPAADILIEAYEQDEAVKKTREYLFVARYAVLPVANSSSAFAKTYASKGLNRKLINQLYFHDLFAESEKEVKIKEPFTIYTRLQKAGASIAFTHFFGFEQKDIKGKAIAGADEHLLKAILRDTLAVSYLPLPVAYDLTSGKTVNGLTILPLDLNGNDRISDDEKFYDDLASVISKIENANSRDIKNLPIEYLHLSVDKKNVAPEAVDFLKWVNQNGGEALHQFGYLVPNVDKNEKEKFEEFASGHSK